MHNFRWGLLSTARINRRLIPAIRASAHGVLFAVASRTAESAEQYAQQWQLPHAFASYEAMLADDRIDIIYNPLPNHLHAEWTIKALRAGKHVLCEKPFALSLEEVDAVIATQKETGRCVVEGFMYRHHAQMRFLDSWLREGKLGELQHLSADFCFTLQDPTNVRWRPEWGGGSLWDVGIYPISFGQWLFGEPPHTVYGTQKIGRTGVDVWFAGQLQYSGSRTAQILSSFEAPFEQSATLWGTEGRLLIKRPFNYLEPIPDPIVFYPRHGSAEMLNFAHEDLYLGQVEGVHASLLHGTAPLITLADSRNHVATALALYQSARENRPISP